MIDRSQKQVIKVKWKSKINRVPIVKFGSPNET